MIRSVFRAFFIHGVRPLLHRPEEARRFWKHLLGTVSRYKPLEPTALPVKDLGEVCPAGPGTTINLVNYEHKHGVQTFAETLAICRIIAATNPQTIFEIGTYEGATTLQMAANSSAEIWTLDLPPDTELTVRDPALDIYPSIPGWRVHNSTFAARCHQLLGDSTSFDFSQWENKVDVVFVDGSHHYEDVRKDTENALRMVHPNGIVLWHDYAPYAKGVQRALDELASSHPLVQIKGTSLAMKPPQRSTS